MNGPADKDWEALGGLLDTLTEAAVAAVVDNMAETAAIAHELTAHQRDRIRETALRLAAACREVTRDA